MWKEAPDYDNATRGGTWAVTVSFAYGKTVETAGRQFSLLQGSLVH